MMRIDVLRAGIKQAETNEATLILALVANFPNLQLVQMQIQMQMQDHPHLLPHQLAHRDTRDLQHQDSLHMQRRKKGQMQERTHIRDGKT